MKTLIVGTSYVHGATALAIFGMWAKLVRQLNPDTDILVVDSKSPTSFAEHLDGRNIELFSFPENIGHLSLNRVDGWGRAFCMGVQTAIDRGYDYMVGMDCDILFAHPVSKILDKMRKYGVRCAIPMAYPYQFTETALSFWDVSYLEEIDFIAKYDWEGAHTDAPPEHRVDKICQEEMFSLPLRGMRNDMRVSTQHMRISFLHGIDWITHAELPHLRLFLEMNNLE